MNIVLFKQVYKFDEKLNDNLTIIGRASIEVIRDSFYIYGSIMNGTFIECSFQYEWTKEGNIINKAITDTEDSHTWDSVIQDFVERAYDYISQQTNKTL